MNSVAAECDDRVTSVLIADDHSLVTDLVSKYLPLEGPFAVSVVRDVKACLEKVRSDGPFDVVLLDVLFPERLSLEAVQRIVKANGDKAVVLFSGNASEDFVQKSMKIGALGFIPKTLSLQSLSSAIELVASGEPFVPASYFTIKKDQRGENGFGLDSGEIAILEKLGEGLANKEIMSSLDLTESTVKMRVRSISRKLGARNRTHAVIVAREAGLI